MELLQERGDSPGVETNGYGKPDVILLSAGDDLLGPSVGHYHDPAQLPVIQFYHAAKIMIYAGEIKNIYLCSDKQE